MRADIFRQSCESPALVFQRYEHHEREHQQTAHTCTAAGFQFVPMVLEGHVGAWSAAARATLDWLARQVAALHQEDVRAASLRIAQRMSCTLHRERTRAQF